MTAEEWEAIQVCAKASDLLRVALEEINRLNELVADLRKAGQDRMAEYGA